MICNDRRPLLSCGSHAEISIVPDVECDHKHSIRQLLPMLEYPGVDKCAAYYGCVVNELVSLNERHLQPTPIATPERRGLYEQAFQLMLKKVRPTVLTKLSVEQVLRRLPQCKRRKYLNASIELQTSGEPSAMSMVRAFLKHEKFSDEFSDPLEMKPARMIQHRSDVYCLMLAQYLKPVEDLVFKKYAGRWVKPSKRMFVKGMNSWQVGRNIAATDKFSDTAWVLFDHSKFDAHVNDDVYDYLRRFIYMCYPNDPHIKRLMRMQSHNKCVTRNGIRYKSTGTLMSGEYNTSLGGCFINAMITGWVLRNVVSYQRYNGDDGVVAISRAELALIDYADFARMGFKTKMDVVYDINMIDFCQCKPIRVSGCWRMVRNPLRVMSRTAYTTKTLTGNGWLKLATAIGKGEHACNTGVPVLQSFSNMIIRSGRGHYSQSLFEEYMFMRSDGDSDDAVVTAEARIDFAVAFGMSPTEQISLEACFDRMDLLVL